MSEAPVIMNGSASWTLSAPAGAVMDLDAQAVGPKGRGQRLRGELRPLRGEALPDPL